MVRFSHKRKHLVKRHKVTKYVTRFVMGERYSGIHKPCHLAKTWGPSDRNDWNSLFCLVILDFNSEVANNSMADCR